MSCVVKNVKFVITLALRIKVFKNEISEIITFV